MHGAAQPSCVCALSTLAPSFSFWALGKIVIVRSGCAVSFVIGRAHDYELYKLRIITTLRLSTQIISNHHNKHHRISLVSI